MDMDGQTIVLISTAVGGGVAGFFMLMAKIVPWRRKDNPGSNNDKHVRKDFCELARGNMEKTLDEIRIDVKTLMRHWDIEPDGEEDE
ncbi:hypothetical protein LCGC14_3115930 [marine sediment metagenome]|uniref:Uncharacterized protein n=1 Tax=marine sediment metagenome TaxID=412755 RepID=A0A0F8YB30_9ZZZZ